MVHQLYFEVESFIVITCRWGKCVDSGGDYFNNFSNRNEFITVKIVLN